MAATSLEADLPGGSNGTAQVGFAALLEGLKQNGTAKGSMELEIADANDDTITFELDSDGVPNGNLAGYVPVELHIRLWDDTTQVAGRWNSDLTGDSGTGTKWGVIAASGFTIIPCYALVANNSNIYVRFTAGASGTGRVEYVLVCARNRQSA